MLFVNRYNLELGYKLTASIIEIIQFIAYKRVEERPDRIHDLNDTNTPTMLSLNSEGWLAALLVKKSVLKYG